jgi:ribosomal protein S2
MSTKTSTEGLVLAKKSLRPGNVVSVKITAMGANNVGINEFSYGIPVLVPNAKLGETVKVKILKVFLSKKLCIAKLIKAHTNKVLKNITETLHPGAQLDVTITKLGPNSTGIAVLPTSSNNVTTVIVKKAGVTVGEKLKVLVTRVKKNYAVAIINEEFADSAEDKASSVLTNAQTTKFTIVLPKKAKRYLKHLVFKVGTPKTTEAFGDKMTETILFIKPRLGAKLGDKVQIKITKVLNVKGNNTKAKYNVLIAKIIKLNPLSNKYKKALVRSSLRQMVKSGMHYGEKAIKCNARMKNYVWTKNLKTNTTVFGSTNSNDLINRLFNKMNYSGHYLQTSESVNAHSTVVEKQYERSVTARPLIKKGRNIINLLKTRRCLNKALAQLTKYAVKGKTFLFVGTKKAAAGLVSRAALFSKKAFFVNTRWLGGMLTNWKTILKSISKIRPILKEKQIIIKDILEKRQNIKTRLIQKALLLRKKSKLILKKGMLLIQLLKSHSKTKNLLLDKTVMLNKKRKDLVSKGILLLEKQKQLMSKQNTLVSQILLLQSNKTTLINTYEKSLNNLIILRSKIRELNFLLNISKELQVFKQQVKQNNQKLYTVSYNTYKTLNNSIFNYSHPPKEILNKMVKIVKDNNNLNLKSSEEVSLSNNSGQNILILTQLLNKFPLFVPAIQKAILTLQTDITGIQTKLTNYRSLLTKINNKIMVFNTLKNKLSIKLQLIKNTLQTERNIVRLLRRKLKQILAQKRLIKFLPKLRYLPTPANNLEQTARFLMKKFVDPKMKYPMDMIYDEKLNTQSKKILASRKKKWQRLEKYLGGISNMTKITEKQIRNNVAIIIGQQEEMNAVRECKKLGIKMFHIVDTNCNPGFADHFIPANDDARNSIKFILGKFLTRIRLAQKLKKYQRKLARNKKK